FDGSIVLPQKIMFQPRNRPCSSSFCWSNTVSVQLPMGSSPLKMTVKNRLYGGRRQKALPMFDAHERPSREPSRSGVTVPLRGQNALDTSRTNQFHFHVSASRVV